MHSESDLANLSTFPVFRHPASSQILAAWDSSFAKLWSADRTIAAQAAAVLYPHEPSDTEPTARESEAALGFLQQLTAQNPQLIAKGHPELFGLSAPAPKPFDDCLTGLPQLVSRIEDEVPSTHLAILALERSIRIGKT